MLLKCIFCLIILLVSACSSFSSRERLLTSEELQKYNLNGILHSAEICPNRFDEKLNRLVVDGPCEVIRCEVINKQTVCHAKPK